MTKGKTSDLIPKKIADWIAFGLFFVGLTFFLILLLGGRLPQAGADSSTTTTSSLQVVRGPHKLEHQTRTVEKVTTSSSLPEWQTILGSHQTVILIGATALLAAYILAAISQRIMLGRYAISVGPLSVPELITRDEVEDAVTSALSSTEREHVEEEAPGDGPEAAQVDEPQRGPGPDGGPVPVPRTIGEVLPSWVNVDDPNLALAGWRIDLERELRRIASEFHLPGRDQRVLRNIVSRLSDMGVLPHSLANSLQDLLTIANQGVHGANVDPGVMEVLRTQGVQLLEVLKTIRG